MKQRVGQAGQRRSEQSSYVLSHTWEQDGSLSSRARQKQNNYWPRQATRKSQAEAGQTARMMQKVNQAEQRRAGQSRYGLRRT